MSHEDRRSVGCDTSNLLIVHGFAWLSKICIREPHSIRVSFCRVRVVRVVRVIPANSSQGVRLSCATYPTS